MNAKPIHHSHPVGQKMIFKELRQIQGAYLVEAAITLTIFIMLILAAIEMAFLVLAYTTVGHLSQEGLRFAVIRGSEAAKADDLRSVPLDNIPADTAAIQVFVRNISTIKPVNTVNVVGCWPGTVGNLSSCPVPMSNGVNNKPGDALSVTVTYQYQTMVIPGSIWFGSPILSSTSVGTVLY